MGRKRLRAYQGLHENTSGGVDHTNVTNQEAHGVVNVAVTFRVWVIDTTQPAAPEQSPDQPLNVDPTSAVAVNVTDVPNKYDCEQSPGHEIPEPDTDPEPLTDTDKLSVVWV